METRPKLSFVDAIRTSIKRKNDVKGRARRSEFWWTTLACAVYSAILNGLYEYVAVPMGVGSEVADFLFVVFGLPVIFTWFPVAYRRLHDAGKSGFMLHFSIITAVASIGALALVIGSQNNTAQTIFVILALASFVSEIIVLLWCTKDSQKGPNKYGPSPKYYEPGEDNFSTTGQHAPETQTEKDYDQCLDELQKETLKHELDKKLWK